MELTAGPGITATPDSAERQLLQEVWHELRTPVAAIQALVGLLAHDHGDDRREAAELVAGHVEHLGALMAAIARVATGACDHLVAEDVTTIDVGELVRAAASAADLPAARLRLRVREADRLQGDRAALRQVLTNLLENARVHGAADAVVGVEVVVRPGELRMVVSNAPAPADIAGGCGIGLAVVRRQVRRLGGSVEVSAPVRRPFRVIVTVPRR